MGEVKRRDEIQGDILHEYDGIEEADNDLPNWWLGIFIGTTAFAIVYWFAYHEFGMAQTQNAIYAEQEAALAAERANVDTSGLAALADDVSLVQAGAATFTTNCVACHGEKGEGKIGPNLTDKFWLHGGGAADIHKQVTEGVPAKGMPGWGAILGPDKVKEVTAYVLTLRNTNVAGKEPQGDEYSGDGS